MRILMGCLTAVVLIPLAGALWLFVPPIWEENARLDKFQGRVSAYPLPPRTQVSDSDAAIDRAPDANGDYCEYMVRLTLQTELSLADIRDYYNKADIAGVSNPAQIYAESPAGGSVVVEFSDIDSNPLDLRCT
ncbi:hypothetical protein [Nonomuraea guangzhouensis]|uniref:Uncharacterized protein n=1 Tax=Nonomuraea guangzhouensis TaxID=1291555 RepID=A0ABW4G7X9_9ACTN|nr:hypothetical protein [Nonomuraea guangzhouensis]